MNEEIKNQNAPTEDIDLLILVERAILFFRKYKWVFLIGLIAGLASGFSIYRSLPKIYKSRLIAHSFLLTNQEEIQIIDNWNELLSKHEYTALAKIFNCPENVLHTLKEIKGDEIQKVFTPTNPNGFLIEVNVTDISLLDALQAAIVYGLENNDYAKPRIELRRANLRELIIKTAQEIQKFDFTKKRLEDILSGNEKLSSLSIIDITGLSKQLIEMNEKLINFKQDLQFANAVQVLQGFSKFKQPVGPKLFVWLFLGLVSFLSLAYLYALISSINEKLKIRAGKK
ncbi:MAG: hypothetical protein JWM28_1225 [Chitinophagaceae bacterium]|nr:hypothetical protein [Chitinophagaceae bacterium]